MMKLSCLLTLLLISTVGYAAEQSSNKLSMGAYLIAQSTVIESFGGTPISQVKQPVFKSFDILDAASANTLVISSLTLSDIDMFNHYSTTNTQTLVSSGINYGFFTEFQLTLKNDLVLTGQWTRLHDSYNDGYETSGTLRPVEWSLATESRASTARELGLNWTVYGGLKAYAKLQTVNSSAWIPQVSIPRFVTQDTDDWTLAAVELVYSF